MRFTLRTTVLIGFLLLSIQALVLYFFGQPLIAVDGTVKLWEGVVLSPGNSQHISDWYSFSHIIHGILFYALLTWLFPRWPIGARFALAIGIEVAWEMIENTPMVINHYRQQALAVGYAGDSILNSVSDTVMAMLGFVLARKLWIVASIALVVALELFVAYAIRDNLTLNIIGLIHPFSFISHWQSGS